MSRRILSISDFSGGMTPGKSGDFESEFEYVSGCITNYDTGELTVNESFEEMTNSGGDDAQGYAIQKAEIYHSGDTLDMFITNKPSFYAFDDGDWIYMDQTGAGGIDNYDNIVYFNNSIYFQKGNTITKFLIKDVSSYDIQNNELTLNDANNLNISNYGFLVKTGYTVGDGYQHFQLFYYNDISGSTLESYTGGGSLVNQKNSSDSYKVPGSSDWVLIPSDESGSSYTNTLTNTGSGERAIMEVFGGSLYIADKNLLHKISPDDVFTDTVLEFDAGENITSLASFNQQLAIGTSLGNFYLWDGVESFVSTSVSQTANGPIYGMKEFENTLYLFPGEKGDIYQYIGSDIRQIARIQKGFRDDGTSSGEIDSFGGVAGGSGEGGRIRDWQIGYVNNGLMIMSDKNGLYYFGRRGIDTDMSIYHYGAMTVDGNDNLYALYILSDADENKLGTRFFIGNGSEIYKQSGTKYSIDYADDGDSRLSPILQTKEIDITDDKGRDRFVQSVGFTFRDIGFNNDLKVYYSADGGDWTLAGTLETDDIDESGSGDLNKRIFVYKRAKRMQFRFEFGGGFKISSIDIYE